MRIIVVVSQTYHKFDKDNIVIDRFRIKFIENGFSFIIFQIWIVYKKNLNILGTIPYEQRRRNFFRKSYYHTIKKLIR